MFKMPISHNTGSGFNSRHKPLTPSIAHVGIRGGGGDGSGIRSLTPMWETCGLSSRPDPATITTYIWGVIQQMKASTRHTISLFQVLLPLLNKQLKKRSRKVIVILKNFNISGYQNYTSLVKHFYFYGFFFSCSDLTGRS